MTEVALKHPQQFKTTYQSKSSVYILHIYFYWTSLNKVANWRKMFLKYPQQFKTTYKYKLVVHFTYIFLLNFIKQGGKLKKNV